MSSRRSRRAHNAHPKYAAEDYELDTDFDSNNNASESTSAASASKRSTRSKTEDHHPPEEEAEEEEEEDDEINEVEEVTRCICGSDDLYIPKNNHGEFDNVDPGFFIQCETCSVWQHGYCVGIKDEENAPEKYWCEKCKPENHTLFIDRFGIRRSKYDPDHPHNIHHETVKKGTKRKNGRFNQKIENAEHSDDQTDKKHIEDETDEHAIATSSNANANDTHDNEQNEEDYEDDDGHKRKHRKRPSYNYKDYNYEEMLKKALEESARESGVAPEEVNLSASEGPGGIRETRHNSLRKTRAKSNDDDLPDDGEHDDESKEKTIAGSANENELPQDEQLVEDKSTTVKAEKPDTYKKTKDLRRNRDGKRGRGRRNASATSASNDEHEEEYDDNRSDQKMSSKMSVPVNATSNKNSQSTPATQKRNNQREKKEPKPTIADDKPFRANIPSARINMNEMTRRIFSITDFVSNIQINLSNEEEFKNNLFKMDDSDLPGDIVELKKTLIGCYNESVAQLDSLSGLLNTWQGDFM